MGLYDFPAREYSITGRWASPDPAGLAAVDPTNPQSWNRYTYVLNNTLAYKDPLGLECMWDDGSWDSISDLESGNPGGCRALGGTWVDRSFFTDFGLGDWSAKGDLAAVAAAIQAGFALVQTGSGLGGWILVANGGAGPIDWNLLGPQLPTKTLSQAAMLGRALNATGIQALNPDVCGGGYFAGRGLEFDSGAAHEGGYVLATHDSRSGNSVGYLLEVGAGPVSVGKEGSLNTSTGQVDSSYLLFVGAGDHLGGFAGASGANSPLQLGGYGAAFGRIGGAYVNLVPGGGCHP